MELTPEEYISKLTCFSLAVTDYSSFGRAVQSVHAVRCKRIFTDGLNSSEQRIGEYSTKPIYVNVNDKTKSPKQLGSPTGKTGKSKFKSGKPHTSKYFDGGYKGFREAIGRSGDTVNLVLFGDLKSNLSSGSRGNDEVKAVQVTPSEYIVGLDADNSNKRKGLESHFGDVPIFAHSKQEIDTYKKTIVSELKDILSKCK